MRIFKLSVKTVIWEKVIIEIQFFAILGIRFLGFSSSDLVSLPLNFCDSLDIALLVVDKRIRLITQFLSSREAPCAARNISCLEEAARRERSKLLSSNPRGEASRS